MTKYFNQGKIWQNFKISSLGKLHKDMIEKHQNGSLFSVKIVVEGALNKVSFLCPSNREGEAGGGGLTNWF